MCSVVACALFSFVAGCRDTDDPLWMELGWDEPFAPLRDGHVLQMRIGSQGARMFPVALRTSGIVSDSGKTADDIPTLDATLARERAQGTETIVVIDAMPLDLRPDPDGTSTFYYVPLIPADAIATEDLSGPAILEASLEIEDRYASFTVRVELRGDVS